MRFGLRDHEMPLDPDVERELEAVDHGLRGLRVETDLEDLRDLAVDVRADRPVPPADFGARLDEWAAAGFPREERPSDGGERASGTALGSLRERLRSVPPRRLVLSAGAAATLVVAVAVGIGVSDELGGSGASPGVTPSARPAQGSSDTAEGGKAPAIPGDVQRAARDAQPKAEANADRVQLLGSSRASFARGKELAAGGRAAHRKVARNADLVLSTEPQDVRNVADGVFRVVDQYNGYVLSSNVTSARATGPRPLPAKDGRSRSQQGSGTIEMRIPAQHLRNALGDMSDLARVTSRTEGTLDITSRFNSAKAHVEDLEAERTSLLNQLGDALTIEEQDSIKAQLRIVENQLADAKDRLGRVEQRIHFVPVGVEIRGERGVDSGGGGGWGIGDALDDAGRVLTVIAGILLISAAALVPLGLLGAVAWITARAVLRRRRESALE